MRVFILNSIPGATDFNSFWSWRENVEIILYSDDSDLGEALAISNQSRTIVVGCDSSLLIAKNAQVETVGFLGKDCNNHESLLYLGARVLVTSFVDLAHYLFPEFYDEN